MTSCIHPFPLEYVLTFAFMDKKLPYLWFQINVMNTMFITLIVLVVNKTLYETVLYDKLHTPFPTTKYP